MYEGKYNISSSSGVHLCLVTEDDSQFIFFQKFQRKYLHPTGQYGGHQLENIWLMQSLMILMFTQLSSLCMELSSIRRQWLSHTQRCDSIFTVPFTCIHPPWQFSFFVALQPGIKIHFIWIVCKKVKKKRNLKKKKIPTCLSPPTMLLISPRNYLFSVEQNANSGPINRYSNLSFQLLQGYLCSMCCLSE